MPPVDEAGVLLLGADGEYRLIALPADEEAHQRFLGLRDAVEFAKTIEKWDKVRTQETAA
jgi:hypothetical protein